MIKELQFSENGFSWRRVSRLKGMMLCLIFLTTLAMCHSQLSVSNEVSESQGILVNVCNTKQKHLFNKFISLLSEYGKIDISLSEQLEKNKMNLLDSSKNETFNKYGTIVLLCPSIGDDDGENFEILNKISSTKNLIIAMSSEGLSGIQKTENMSLSVKRFLHSLEIEYGSPYDNTNISDNYYNVSGNVNMVQITEGLKKAVFTNNLSDLVPVVYKGKAHYILNNNNKHLFSILYGNPSTYVENVSNISSDIPAFFFKCGTSLSLITGVQSFLNGRTIISLSNSIYSDEFINTGNNMKFLKELLKWTLNKKNIIKVNSFDVVSSSEKMEFEPNETIRVEFSASELVDGKYIPLVRDDIQVELRLIERLSIVTFQKREGAAGSYFANLNLPSHHGFYKVIVRYNRPGYNFINEHITVFVKPIIKHSQDPLQYPITFYYIIFAINLSSIPIITYYLILTLRKKICSHSDKLRHTKKTA